MNLSMQDLIKVARIVRGLRKEGQKRALSVVFLGWSLSLTLTLTILFSSTVEATEWFCPLVGSQVDSQEVGLSRIQFSYELGAQAPVGMVMAAGKGTRLYQHTKNQAKPSIPFLDIPMVGYPLYHLTQLGVENVVVSTHWKASTMRQGVETLTPQTGLNVQFSSEEKESSEPLNSGGGLRFAESKLGRQTENGLSQENDIIIVNADGVMFFAHDNGLKPFVEHHQQTKAFATLLTTNNEEVGGRLGGVKVSRHGKIIGFGKTLSAIEKYSGVTLQHYTGYMMVSRKVFDKIKGEAENSSKRYQFFPDLKENPTPNVLTQVIMEAEKKGHLVQAFHDPNILWFETGTIEHFNEAVRFCLEQIKNNGVWKNSITPILEFFNKKPEELVTQEQRLVLDSVKEDQ